ncbi:MAG: HAD family hydrolase [Candidatus Electrothrix sp. AR3]|nr:HAD family hydrolase [Candidatus Electrothrix sp. AR3]
MKKIVVIFDFDGTLADSFHCFQVIINKLAQEFNFRSVQTAEVDAFRNKNSREVIHALQIPVFKLPIILARAKKEFNKVMPEIQVFPGIRDVLLQLKVEKIMVGLLTSNAVDNVQCFLKNNQLDLFDFIYTSSGLWGKTRRLKKTIAKHNFARSQVFYIGDETRDIEAARKAGVSIISVAWGYNTIDALKVFSPDYLINTPQEILAICAKER